MSVSAVSSSQSYNPFAARTKSVDETSSKEILQPAEVRRFASLNLEATRVPADFMQKLLEARFTRPVGEPDNAPSELYADVKVGSKVIARLYNSGGCETPNAFSGVQFGGPDEAGLTGPALAQHRAEKIAKAYGGTIEKADTAVTQAEYDARPPRQFYIDYEALNAEMERLRLSAEARYGSYRATSAGPVLGQSTSISA
ncbi:MAG TPA: hypothetical protein VHM01_02645 [Alphaproteobacteria bacterium]|nr:hypothetical protein [Alphaproteobacteria bacterium]